MGEFVTEMDHVHSLNDDTKCHVDDAKNDGHFHFHRVSEADVVAAPSPPRIHTKQVRHVRVLESLGHLSTVAFNLMDLVACSEQVERDRSDLVVDETHVNGRDRHDHEEVTPTERNGEHLVAHEGKGLLVADAHESKDQEDGSVKDVTKHDSEKEGEDRQGKEGWVGLLVASDTIGIDNALEGTSVLVRGEIGRDANSVHD